MLGFRSVSSLIMRARSADVAEKVAEQVAAQRLGDAGRGEVSGGHRRLRTSAATRTSCRSGPMSPRRASASRPRAPVDRLAHPEAPRCLLDRPSGPRPILGKHRG